MNEQKSTCGTPFWSPWLQSFTTKLGNLLLKISIYNRIQERDGWVRNCVRYLDILLLNTLKKQETLEYMLGTSITCFLLFDDLKGITVFTKVRLICDYSLCELLLFGFLWFLQFCSMTPCQNLNVVHYLFAVSALHSALATTFSFYVGVRKWVCANKQVCSCINHDIHTKNGEWAKVEEKMESKGWVMMNRNWEIEINLKNCFYFGIISFNNDSRY